MKTKIEQIVLGSILAPLAPLALFMAGWWAAYEFLPGKWIALGALAGLALGCAIDLFLLKRLMSRAHGLNTFFWATVFLFYTVGVFGLFMGVPVFNAILAIPAGFVIGGKLAAENANQTKVRRTARRAAGFTAGVLTLVCVASAAIALMSSSTAHDLQGMLGLGFEVTQGMILGLIAVGGMALLAFDWLATLFSVRFTYSLLQNRA